MSVEEFIELWGSEGPSLLILGLFNRLTPAEQHEWAEVLTLARDLKTTLKTYVKDKVKA